MKKIISFMLSAVIALMFICVDVQAATVVVKTEDELRTALKNNGKVILGSDITLTKGIYIENSFSLDLNGYDIIFDQWCGIDATFSVMDLHAVVEIVDTAGGSSFRNKNENVDGWLILEVEESEIIGVDVSNLLVYAGKNSIANSKIDYVHFIDIYYDLEVNFYSDVTTDKILIEGGTYNFDPTKLLNTGLFAIDNNDGTFTIRYRNVQESGVKQKLYFDNYIDEEGKYCFWDVAPEKYSADELVIEIYYVTGNSMVYFCYELVPEDSEGKLWSVEIDKAYANAFCGISTEDGLLGTLQFVMPYEDNAVVDANGNITVEEKEEAELPSEMPEENTTEITTEIPTEKATDNETQTESIGQSNDETKVPNEDLPYIVGVVCFVIIVVISIIVVLAYKKKQESSL